MKNILKSTSLVLQVAVFVLFASRPAGAEQAYEFRVMFEHIQGTESLVAGDLSDGIRQLEQRLQSDTDDQSLVIATLCGGYILARDLDKARVTCAEAVQRFPSESAFNNRGVLRAMDGDLIGAARDFDRARPRSMAEYIEILKTRDIGFIATGNHERLQALVAEQGSSDIYSSFSEVRGADVEVIE